MNSYSPLRYPGGKGQIYSFVQQLLVDNGMVGCTYIEPYAGGAGVAMRLLFEKKVSRVIINDFDRSVYAVWHSILNRTEEFIDLINETPVTIDTWNVQKKIQHMKCDSSLLSLGFSTFFLNRTNHSGIINAGMIGGKEQKGNYKIDCRFNKANLTLLVQKIASYKEKIELYNLDAIDFIDKVKRKHNQFYFIDPPYYKKGKELYTNFYTHADHLNLSKYIKKNLKNKKMLLSYDNCDEIKNMYKTYNLQIKYLNYYIATKRKGEEIFITNNLQ